ncbi:MAG: Crp/Fnr family transcriptional regulator [Candidatus Acidiferrales bacterium]
MSIALDPRSASVKAMQARAPRPWPSTTRFKTELKEKQAFDAQAFLDSEGPGRKVAKFRRKETLFAQGDRAKNVMYIQKGCVELTVVNDNGKEAVVGILGPGDFLGVRCIAGRFIRRSTATAIAPTTVLVMEKNEMIRLLHEEPEFSDRFIASMLARSVREEETLIDQLLDTSEKRLLHTLLLLASFGAPGHPQNVLPNISQETLAEMIGTTRSRVNLFMNKFRKLGFIEYRGRLRGLQINKSRLSAILQD